MANPTKASPSLARRLNWLLLLVVGLILTACDAQPAAQTPPAVATASPPSTIAAPASTAEPATAAPTATTPATVTPTATLPTPDTSAPTATDAQYPTDALLFYHSDGHLYTVPLGGQSRRLTTQPLAGANEPFIVDGMFGFRPPVVSPDGCLLALNGNWGGATVLDLVTGEMIGMGRGRAMQSPNWSPDSRQLAYVTQDDRLCIYDLNSEPDDCPFAPEGLLMEVVWSPTGSFIAAAVVTPPVGGSSDCCVGRVWLVDPATGVATDVAGFITGFEYAPGEAFQWLPDGSGLAIKRADDSHGAIFRLADGSVVTFDEWIADVAPDGGTVLHPSGALSAIDGTALAPLTGADGCAEFLGIARSWSPDSRLAYTILCGVGGTTALEPRPLTVIDPATGVVGWQRELPVGLFPVGWSPDGQFILLDDAAVASPIWRLAADGTGELEVVVEDGRLVELIPAGK